VLAAAGEQKQIEGAIAPRHGPTGQPVEHPVDCGAMTHPGCDPVGLERDRGGGRSMHGGAGGGKRDQREQRQ
jgi:hypothetical protein